MQASTQFSNNTVISFHCETIISSKQRKLLPSFLFVFGTGDLLLQPSTVLMNTAMLHD